METIEERGTDEHGLSEEDRRLARAAAAILRVLAEGDDKESVTA